VGAPSEVEELPGTFVRADCGGGEPIMMISNVKRGYLFPGRQKEGGKRERDLMIKSFNEKTDEKTINWACNQTGGFPFKEP